jgi:hypothetical protein
MTDKEMAEEYCNNEVPFDTTESGEKLYTENDLKNSFLAGYEACENNAELVVKKNLTTDWSFKESKWIQAEKMTKCEGCKFYKWYDLNLYNEPTWVKVCMNPKKGKCKRIL